jgi:hypothetical protein
LQLTRDEAAKDRGESPSCQSYYAKRESISAHYATSSDGSVSGSAGKETIDEKQAQHFGQSQM